VPAAEGRVDHDIAAGALIALGRETTNATKSTESLPRDELPASPWRAELQPSHSRSCNWNRLARRLREAGKGMTNHDLVGRLTGCAKRGADWKVSQIEDYHSRTARRFRRLLGGGRRDSIGRERVPQY